MANTTNYNLKKPAASDYYNVQDQNDNMDIIDAQLKANDDNAAAKIPKSLATAADQVPISSGVGAWAVKTLAQFKTWLGLGAAAYAAIANNLTTTATGSVLDASQGKALNDLISTKQNSTDNTLQTTSKQVVGAINEVFTSASNGKTLIANAITGKNIPTLPTDTYQQMADNIGLLGAAAINYYNNGVENNPVEVGYSYTGSGSGSQSKGASYLNLATNGYSGGDDSANPATTRSYQFSADLTNIAMLKIDWEGSDGTDPIHPQFALQVVNDTQKTLAFLNYTASVGINTTFSRTVSVLNVSSLSGTYTIRVICRSINARNNTAKVYRIWGE